MVNSLRLIVVALCLIFVSLYKGVDCLALPDVGQNDSSNTTEDQSGNVSKTLAMPQQMNLAFKMNDETMVELNLTMNADIRTDAPFLVACNGSITNWKQDSSSSFAVYSDVNSMTSILVEMTNESGQMVNRFHGTTTVRGTVYSIAPADDLTPSYDGPVPTGAPPSGGGVFKVQIDGMDHMMKETNMNETTKLYADIKTSVLQQTDGLNMADELLFNSNILMDTPSGFQSYVVETLVVVDYALFNRFYSQSTSTAEANQKIQYYFLTVINGVDMRYSTLRQSDFSIDVRLAGFYVATSQSESLWTESSIVKIYYGIDAYSNIFNALTMFEQWLPTVVSQLGISFNQATLFSGNNLFDGTYGPNGAPHGLSGLAEIGGICKINQPQAFSVAICREFGEYSSIETAAHEIGHNLGAQHDGTGNNCNTADQYIMAAAPAVLTSTDFNNPFTFSVCSIYYFRTFLISLTMSTSGNCLLLPPTSPVVPPPNTLQGLLYNPDQQCRLLYGSTSFYCAGGNNDQTICQTMTCWMPDTRACSGSAELRAYEGTPCASGRLCLAGQCAADGRSPPATPTSCVYGDYRDVIRFDTTTTLTCAQMGTQQPWRCYNAQTALQCCKTCATISNPNKPRGCQYGDKNPSYCVNTVRSSCYDSTYVNTCCDTCSRLASPNPSCAFGDKAAWCSNIQPSQCYASNCTCCETCQKNYQNYPGCEYGDMAPWCSTSTTAQLSSICNQASTESQCCSTCRSYSQNTICPTGDTGSNCNTITPDQCYAYSSTCCNTCSKSYIGTPGCQYGDKASWCASYVKGPAECQDPTTASTCCRSCDPYKTNTCAPACVDSAPYCSTIFAGLCYNSGTAAACCNTCNQLKQANTNCLYGDSAQWCNPQICDTYKSNCCFSCPN